MSLPRDPRIVVVALGTGALTDAPGGTTDPWARDLGAVLSPLAELVVAGFRLVVIPGTPPPATPRVSTRSRGRGPEPPPVDRAVAASQGGIGYVIQQDLGNQCRLRSVSVTVATIVTRVVVDPGDPAFGEPTTPIGPLYPAAEVQRLRRQRGWVFARAGRRGYRRVVPSPRPLRVLEGDLVRGLTETGAVPIACGGGGVPVVETPDGYRGVEAVVETEWTAEALATGLEADRLLLLTGVPQLAVGFGTSRAIGIERLTVAEARALAAAGEFPARSVGPKVLAGVRFVEQGGREAIITTPGSVRAAIDGEGGTRIVL